METNIATSKGWYSTRFRILRRDKFTCQYCGQKAPNVILHVDHVIPRAAGGSNEDGNLVTACSACNIGRNLEEYVGHVSRRRGRPPKGWETSLVAYLASVGEATIEDIVQAMGIPKGTAKSQLSRMGEKLSRRPLGGGRIGYSVA